MTSRPATRQDFLDYYGQYFPYSALARIVESDEGRVIFGLAKQYGYWVAFYDSELDEKTHKKLIIQCFKELSAMMQVRTIPIFAQFEKGKTKDSFLRHFNFEKITDELYQWQH